MIPFPFNLVLQFLATFVIELLVVWAFIRKDVKQIVLYVFLINLFSWPLANFINVQGIPLLVVEAFVVIVESILIMLIFKLKYWKSLLIAFLANLVSFVIGFLIFSTGLF